MNRSTIVTALAVSLLAAGCVSKASLDAAYDASLQRWKGATQAELESAWGKPMLVAPGAEGPVLTWVVRNDDTHDRPGYSGAGTLINRQVGNTTVGTMTPGAIAAASVPITCTTHFAMKGGHVASWTFEGLGCGAPY